MTHDETPRSEDPETTEEAVLGEVARAIRELDRVAGLELACEVGQLVLDHLYDGDGQRLRTREPDDERLRRLSLHPDLGLGRRGLERVVAVFELLADLGGPAACRHLGAEHFRAVLPLSAALRRELLELAESHCWSVPELEHAVRVMASQQPGPASARGPAPSTAAIPVGPAAAA